MADHSFDIVSKLDNQEVKNAVQQADKEIQNRYDLKDSNSTVEFKSENHQLTLNSSDEYKAKAILEILKLKLINRGISAKALDIQKLEIAQSGKTKQLITLQQGIPTDKAKTIIKDIKEKKLKVNTQLQNDQIRVSSKKIDTLQSTMQFVKEKNYPVHLQFLNYR